MSERTESDSNQQSRRPGDDAAARTSGDDARPTRAGRLRRVIGGIIALMILLVASLAGLQYAGVVSIIGGGRGLDAWVARQVTDLLEFYIVPDIEFETFALDAQNLTMQNVVFIAPDGTQVLTANSLVVGLPSIPKRGQPVRIARVEIDRPTLRLIQTEMTGPEGEARTGFKGLVPFVERSRVTEQEEAPSDKKLSNVLRIRRIALTDAEIVYDPVGEDPPMRLTDIDLGLDVTPAEGEEEQGWYALNTTVDRAPVFQTSVDGRMNIDTFTLDLDSFGAALRLNDEGLAALPPQLQSLLRQYDARGTIDVNGGGVIPLRDFEGGDFHAEISSSGVNVGVGQGRLPIERALIGADLREGSIILNPIDVSTLGGSLTGQGRIDLNRDFRPTDIRWKIQNVSLQQALRAPQEGAADEPTLAGNVASEGRASLELHNMPASIDGRGTLTITDGRLVRIPVIQGMINAADALSSAEGLNDKLLVDFLLRPDGVRIESFELIDPTIAARGSGMIYYDGRLEMSANGGPLEGMQASLGALGDLLGQITDQLVKYKIRGTFDEPTVSVVPFGSAD